jgi:hypothetical protein
MSNVTPLHPANAERARALVSSIPAPNAPLDFDAITRQLPEFIGHALALILDDFDIDAHPCASTAMRTRSHE